MKTKVSYFLALTIVFFLCQSQISKTNRNTNESLDIKSVTEAKATTAQVFVTDLVVQGSACVGLDCNSGESFGFDTQRYKENNLRVHFDDTSSSASFPSNDWRIVINDTSNGGASYFAVEDSNTGRIPFKIGSGAPVNSLIVEGTSGDIGIGTGTPVLEMHIADGDSPGIRLEQNGSSGFGAQTWDMAGNETNFFVRDVTNGSKLPFKILPNSPDNSLRIGPNGVSITNAILPGATNPSDIRLKEKFVSLNDATSVIKELSPISYHYKSEMIKKHNYSSKKQYGFIAQEVEKVLPEIVREVALMEDGVMYKTMSYESLIPFLVKGFQEQQDVIEKQSSRIVALESKLQNLEKLEARLDRLEGNSSKVINSKR